LGKELKMSEGTKQQKKRIQEYLRRPAGWLLIASAALILIFFTIKTMITRANAPVEIVIYAFSTMEEVLEQGIFPAFEQKWETETGTDLTIRGVFGASGTIAGQVNLGAPADIAIFSNIHHVNWLKLGRMINRNNQAEILVETPMVIITRLGNPANILEYVDLSKPGIKLLHADPNTSGAGEWAVLAEYGSNLIQSQDPVLAEEQLVSIWENVSVMGSSARSTLTLFELGAGDAMVTYEQDARLAKERGVSVEIVIPTTTILAQPVVIQVDKNVKTNERQAVEAFVDFLLANTGQEIFTSYHFRPLNGQTEDFPPIINPFLVDDLDGWSSAHSTIIEGIWKDEIKPELESRSPLILENGED